MLDQDILLALSEIDREGRKLKDSFELRLVDNKPRLVGHAAVFNSRSEEIFGFYEVIEPGAFRNALKKSDVRFLINHEGMPLARTDSGTMSLAEDERGLAFDAELDPQDPDVQRLMPKIRRRDINQMSFGFLVGDGQRWSRDGEILLRTIREFDEIFDVSAVTYPAYKQTNIQARSLIAARMKVIEAAPAPIPVTEEEQKRVADFLAAHALPPDHYDLKTILKKFRP